MRYRGSVPQSKRGERPNWSKNLRRSNRSYAVSAPRGQFSANWPRGSSYFFFSVCGVCLRKRGLYFDSFSFSPPGLRRSV